MTEPEAAFSVEVDVTNPGQFFACCGLLELSHRLWQGTLGWFSDFSFNVFASSCQGDALTLLLNELAQTKLSGLDESEDEERKQIEAKRREFKRRQLAKGKKEPSQKANPADQPPEGLRHEDKQRLKELGRKARKGSLLIGGRFSVMLDWWQNEDDVMPKTWAGLQEIHKIARAAQAAMPPTGADAGCMFDYGCILVTPPEYVSGKKEPEPVEPFYFDARRFAHALDAGFSLDVQGAEAIAHPAVELLCLIGLQRFRPRAGDRKWTFSYWAWRRPLSAPVAATVVSGAVLVNASQQYQFDLRFRDDQKRYKAFGFSRQSGEQR
jgi:CRISPR-associated protein Csb3